MASDSEPLYVYKQNQFYINYEKQKQVIKSKYPPRIFYTPTSGRDTKKDFDNYLSSGDRELFNQYLKEIADLLFKADGEFQKFTWDTMAEVDKLEMERKARGRLSGTGEYS